MTISPLTWTHFMSSTILGALHILAQLISTIPCDRHTYYILDNKTEEREVK